ncbi:hypothetical protein DFR86_11705 [Acidianus sulfidivorans JP7]|uniref:Uncharacterized protein n=1 Tax=Acidianus sulfidivorans JP7 TaxID=619593 RepID=A0A2U9IQ43_9CREN|nr:hypothetical protein [Acidianus sulfidivorans]AWR98135.1 hypothetical protein DFR86_11705 [Acidianus sulfidivorans JP7]
MVLVYEWYKKGTINASYFYVKEGDEFIPISKLPNVKLDRIEDHGGGDKAYVWDVPANELIGREGFVIDFYYSDRYYIEDEKGNIIKPNGPLIIYFKIHNICDTVLDSSTMIQENLYGIQYCYETEVLTLEEFRKKGIKFKILDGEG